MIVLQHHEVIQTILEDWHASLVKDTAGGMTIVRDEDLRRLINELMEGLDRKLSAAEDGVREIATGEPAVLP